VLVDPTVGLNATSSKGFLGRTLTIDEQRTLFRRWVDDPTVHPHEALVGILAPYTDRAEKPDCCVATTSTKACE